MTGVLLAGTNANTGFASVSPISGTTSDPIAHAAHGSSVGNVIGGVLDYDECLALGDEGYGDFEGPYTVRLDLGSAVTLLLIGETRYVWIPKDKTNIDMLMLE